MSEIQLILETNDSSTINISAQNLSNCLILNQSLADHRIEEC
jgi:hypothetical protein